MNFETRLASAINRSSRKSCLRPATSMMPEAGLRAGRNSWSAAGRLTAAAAPVFKNSRRFISPPSRLLLPAELEYDPGRLR